MQVISFEKYIDFLRTKMGGIRDYSHALIWEHDYRVFLYLHFALLKEDSISEADKNDILIAGLFHDLLEDTPLTEEELAQFTNPRILSLVKELTVDFKSDSIANIVAKMAEISDYAKIIKSADIFDNVSKGIFFHKSANPEFYEFYHELLLNYQSMLEIWITSPNKVLSKIAAQSVISIQTYLECSENKDLSQIKIADK